MAVIAPIVSTFDNRGIRQAERGFDGLAENAGKAFRKIGDFAKVAVTAVAGVAAAAGVGAWKAIEAASDLGEAQSKVGVIFGDSAAEIERFAATAASKFGQSKQDVLNAAGVFGTFGQAAGLSGDRLAQFSNDFTGLASDLASFNNTTPQEAIDAIGAALRGEAEPLRRYGVLLDDATLKAKALELGIYDGNGSLTAQQKILAAEQAIYEQTSAAQGDFARTSGGLANQSRILKAQLANVVAQIGQKLLPVAVKIGTFINDRLVPVVQMLADTFDKEGLGGVLRKVGGYLQEAIPPALEKVKELLGRLGTWLLETGLPWIGEKLQLLTAALWEWIKAAVPPALERLGELLGDLANWILDTGLPLLVEKVKKLGDALVEWIKPQIRPMLQKLGEWLVALGEWILTTAVPKLVEQALKLAGALISWTAKLLPEVIAGLWEWLVGIGRWIVTTAIPNAVRWAGDMAAKMGEKIADFLLDLPSTLWELATKFATLGVDIGKAIVNALIGVWNKLDLKFPRIEVPSWVPGVGGRGFGGFDLFPDIPALADGGIVSSPTLALIGEAGPEAVVPLDRMNDRRQVVININGAIDPVGTARQIRQILQRDAQRLGLGAVV